MRLARLCFFVLAFALVQPCLALSQTARENLVIEGVPEIPAGLIERVEQYQNMRAAVFQDWAPTGDAMLLTTRFGETAQLHRIDMPGGARRQLTFFPERVSMARFCPQPGKKMFVFRKDIGGSEAYQLYRFDLATGKVTLLTDGKSRNEDFQWSHDGTRIVFTSTRRNGKDMDLYIRNPAASEPDKLLLQVEGAWSIQDWSPDDSKLLLMKYVSVNESYLYLLEVASGKLTPLTPWEGNEKVSYGRALFSKDGRGVYISTDKGDEFVRLYAVDLASGSRTLLTGSIPWDVEEFDLSPDGRTLALVANEDGFGKLHLIDTAERKELPPPDLPPGQVSNLRFSPDGSKLAVNIDSARAPVDIFTLDTKTWKPVRWTFSETGGLDASSFCEPQLIHFPTFDKVDGKPRILSAILALPDARFKPPYPILLDIHGGPEGQARPGFWGSYNYFLNEMGIAVLLPNVRGSTGYGKTFSKLDNGSLREDTIKDIGALLDWIATRPDLDAGRVAVSGGSYGGYMALSCLTHYSDRLRCGIDYVGISNFVTFLENTSPYRQDLRRAEYGDERDPGMKEFLLKISPTTNAEKIRKPLFIVQGANDPRVPASEAEQILKAVRGHGIETWYVLAKDEGHGFSKKKNRDYLQYARILFLEKFLLGKDAGS